VLKSAQQCILRATSISTAREFCEDQCILFVLLSDFCPLFFAENSRQHRLESATFGYFWQNWHILVYYLKEFIYTSMTICCLPLHLRICVFFSENARGNLGAKNGSSRQLDQNQSRFQGTNTPLIDKRILVGGAHDETSPGETIGTRPDTPIKLVTPYVHK
jgi:hypothetical protein